VDDGRPVQHVGKSSRLEFEQWDASGWSTQVLDARIGEIARAPFDLERGPLLRVCLLRLAPSDHALLVVTHHIAVDLWSLVLLFAELSLVYASMHTRTLPPERDPGIDYFDFVAWQADYLAGPEAQPGWQYWERRLLSFPPVLDLPTDRSR